MKDKFKLVIGVPLSSFENNLKKIEVQFAGCHGPVFFSLLFMALIIQHTSFSSAFHFFLFLNNDRFLILHVCEFYCWTYRVFCAPLLLIEHFHFFISLSQQ